MNMLAVSLNAHSLMGAVHLFAVVFGIFAGLSWLAFAFELRSFSGGRCKKHQREYEHFDTDSQGGRGYACRNEEDSCHTWISWPADSRRPYLAMLKVTALEFCVLLFIFAIVGFSVGR